MRHQRFGVVRSARLGHDHRMDTLSPFFVGHADHGALADGRMGI